MSVTDFSRSNRLASGDPIRPAPFLARHILVGYWHNWQASPAAYIPLSEVSHAYDVINVAFAVAEPGTAAGEISFRPCRLVSDQQFLEDVRTVQERGAKVLISVGGANGSTGLDDPTARARFSETVSAVIRRYGFDGLDLNLERSVALDEDDVDFRQPRSASVRHLIAAVREIRSRFGADFVLSLAPEVVNVQAGFGAYAGHSGSYLPLIHALRDTLTYVQVQHYNGGPLAAPDRATYAPGSVGYHTALAGMLLRGFPVEGDPRRFFPALRPDQVVLGVAANPEAVDSGYTEPAALSEVFDGLVRAGRDGGVGPDSSDLQSLRGLMTWSINWDAADGGRFSSTLRAGLDALL